MNKLKNIDIEAKLFMWILHLDEVKSKNYSPIEPKHNKAYVFRDYEDLKAYFARNGAEKIDEEILDLCIMKETNKGTIISLKGICDHTIRSYRITKILSEEEIRKIHSDGRLTPEEKVKQWESAGVCMPGNAVGIAKDRCETFENCHDCLTEYANGKDSYTESNFKVVNNDFKEDLPFDDILMNAIDNKIEEASDGNKQYVYSNKNKRGVVNGD